MKNPKRDIPLSLLYGTLTVSALYILANVAYLMLLPVQGHPNAEDTLSRGIMFASNDRVGTAAAEMIFGNPATIIMAIFIMISTFGCNNGIILSGARVYYAMAKDKLFFKKAGELNSKGVPAFSLWIQCGWACLLCLTGTYSDLLDYTVFAILVFYILTIFGVFVLRKKQPNVQRPYKAFGYPVIPAIYLLFAVALCVNLLIYKPIPSWAGVGIVALGIPVFYLWKNKK
jgi:APA family basic amino acid/polyamine antiporter